MKGGAKSRKKLSKKKEKFQYTAPRLGKDGKMTEASLNTYDPSVNIMDRNTAATNIQSRYRGKKTRSKYDMKSKWYKGFPTEAPEVALDLENISRITDRAIQGLDSRRERENIESKRKQVNDTYRKKYEKLGKLDELKYDWGKYYDDRNKSLSRNVDPAFLSQGRTHIASVIPSREEQDIIRFEKKNYDKLKRIANKKKYWQQKLEKSDIASEYTRFNPNRVTNTPQFNIRSTAVDYLENPEDTKKNYGDYFYKGKYFDPDTDTHKFFKNYKVEDPPELSPINSDDSVEYNTDDELLLPRKDIVEAVDYYKDRKTKHDKLDKKHHDYMTKYDKLDVELDKKLELDIEKCLHAKKMAKADIKLYKDPFFMENYYEPCSDNENLTDIYMDTFYSLPWELIRPVSSEKFGETIDDMIHNIPRGEGLWKNSLIIYEGQDKFREILRNQGLLVDPYQGNRVDQDNYYEYGFHNKPLETLLELSNFYRWATPGSIKLVHLPNKPKIYSRLPGRSHLQETLNRLSNAYFFHPEYFNDNVEKVKRYFILRLIGIIGNPEYPEILQNFIYNRIKVINDIKINLEHFEKELENVTNFIKDIYAGFEYKGHKIDLDKFISEYKRGLLGGLTQEDDETMHYLTGQMDEIKSDISKYEKRLPKLEKDLETAKRFSRIKGMPKDYMNWEPEKLIYE